MTSYGPEQLENIFELLNVGQGSQIIDWFREYQIHYSIYPFVHVTNMPKARTEKLIVSFEGGPEIATAFALRWAGRDSKD